MCTTLGMGTIELCLLLSECRRKEKIAPGVDISAPKTPIVLMTDRTETQRDLICSNTSQEFPNSPRPITLSIIYIYIYIL